jgi:hypothetical protein
VAEKIEIQTRYAAELQNVDVQLDNAILINSDFFPVDTGASLVDVQDFLLIVSFVLHFGKPNAKEIWGR